MHDKMEAISAVAALIGIVWFFYVPWQRILVDIIRQRLFEIRDDVFNLAASGKIKFDDPAYVTFRSFINTMVRYAEQFSWPRLFFLSRVGPQPESELPTPEEILSSIEDEEVRKKMVKRFKNACGLYAMLMWLRSPFLLVLSVPFALLTPLVLVSSLITDKVVAVKKWLAAGFKLELQREVLCEEQHGG